MVAEVTAVGVDTWSPAWSVAGDSCAGWLRENATQRSKGGAMLVPSERTPEGYRVGWFPGSELMFAEGHPVAGALCPGPGLGDAYARLVRQTLELGIPLPNGVAGADWLSDSSSGAAGVRRLDVTANVEFVSGATGLAWLAGAAACARDAPGHAVMHFGQDRRVETVYLKGYSGRRTLAGSTTKGWRR